MGIDNSVGETTREDERFGYPCECANDACKCDAGDCDCDTECRHDRVDLALGFGGDPAREDPRRGTCFECNAEVHWEWGETPYEGWWEVD